MSAVEWPRGTVGFRVFTIYLIILFHGASLLMHMHMLVLMTTVLGYNTSVHSLDATVQQLSSSTVFVHTKTELSFQDHLGSD